ncbi:hypothetical protein K0U91_12820 [Chryseobacterium chendengshani]|uniref:hypothetical protein n=1 Tax=Chryseobacterium sp. LJ668 TaxID=2864040 RepID=UPI001C68FCA8|nr:hypothetical protein [Chryseobacterium sp. LJ668]MBW8523653.1 hypothetical protein [Chryseobacterium sp. LJ668]QYK15935.1 hypothetical protein K0U91_12820 [Chryseobacterium sp. LJ668]
MRKILTRIPFYQFVILLLLVCCKTADSFSLRKMNKNERFDFISSNIKISNGVDLGNVIYHLKESKVDLDLYHKILMDKLKDAKYPYDINLLAEILLENEHNKPEIESILNSKIKIWDTGNWSEKFWYLIKEYNLKITEPTDYSLQNDFEKKYNILEFMKAKITENELGENPLLMVDEKITSYEEGKLIEYLNTLDIKQIDYTSKQQSVNLYGKDGIDGFIRITTR